MAGLKYVFVPLRLYMQLNPYKSLINRVDFWPI